MEHVKFSTLEETERKIDEIYHNIDILLLDFGDKEISPQILSFILNIFRKFKSNNKKIIFIVPNKDSYDKLYIQGFVKYFEIYRSINEYENISRFSKFSISLVIDDENIKSLLSDVLIKEGFKVFDYTIESFEKKESNLEDIIILDYYNNISSKVVKKIIDFDREIPIILLINENEIDNGLELMNFGVNELIKKPIKTETTVNSIKRIAFEDELIKENKRLFEEIKEREQEITKLYTDLENELKLASDIQKSMIPENDLYYENYRLRYKYEPSQDIGGDFCDVIELNHDEVAVVFADISGHGIPASLLSSMLKVYILNHSFDILDPSELMKTINEEVIKTFPEGKFISIFYLIINFRTNEIRYCKASQEPALYINGESRNITELETEGQVLGLFSAIDFPEIVKFETKTMIMNNNDKIFLYTDGIVEATDKNGNYYGLDRLKNLVYENMDHADLLDVVEEDLKTFTDSQKLEDDLTLFLIERGNFNIGRNNE